MNAGSKAESMASRGKQGVYVRGDLKNDLDVIVQKLHKAQGLLRQSRSDLLDIKEIELYRKITEVYKLLDEVLK